MESRIEFGLKMEEVYKLSGISRQYYHKMIHRQIDDSVMWQRLEEMVIEYRKDRPRSSARKIHRSLRISEVGINWFENYISEQGLSIKRYKKYIRTTHPGTILYPNLVNGIELNGINQVWVSDITYYITAQITLYIVLILDVYSRRIIGYSGSDNMMAVNNQKALQMAFRQRKQKRFDNLIHHSDKGSQYGANLYTKMLQDANIKISMANNCLENPYAERINGIIKNDYLFAYNINNLHDLQKALPKAVSSYNHYPHGKLKQQKSPVEFEEYLSQFENQNGETIKLYNYEK